jgi:hypothetical protein
MPTRLFLLRIVPWSFLGSKPLLQYVNGELITLVGIISQFSLQNRQIAELQVNVRYPSRYNWY